MMLEPDLLQAQRFITLLADDDPVTFQTFDERPSKTITLARILHGPLEQHADTLAQLNANGAGVFIMANRGDNQGRMATNVTGIRALFVDLDGSPLEPVLTSNAKPHISVESSPGRFHAYWRVNDCSLKQFTSLQVLLAARFNSDHKVKDLPRVMRLPGFWHQKGKPFQTRLLQANPAPSYTVADLMVQLGLSAHSTSGSVSNIPAPSLLSEYPPALAGFDQGERDDRLFRYACNLRARGMKKGEARLLVLAAAGKCRPPMSEAEAAKCLESAWHYDSAHTEHLTDVGNAKRLVKLHGRNLRYIPEFKKWLVWDGQRWLMDEDGETMRRAKGTASMIYSEAKNASEAGDRGMADKLASHAGKTQSASRLKDMIELARSEPGIPARPHELDQDNYLLGVSNGTINLRTGALRESRREDYLTKQAQVAYDPNAEAPIFRAFLKRIMGGNKALMDFVQRAIGYSLSGDTAEQCLLFLYGSGANGKSTLLKVFRELLGDYAMQCSAETLMIKQHSGISNDIARLRGARFVATSEIEDGRRLAECMIKQLTGQDTIVARFLYTENFEYVPNFKIWLAANHKPVIRGDDYATWRRIHLVPFTVTIPPEEQDKNLLAKLREEYPGILTWAVEGCQEYQRQGLNPPEEVRNATEGYRREMDLIGRWIEECCITASHATAQASVLYGNYKRWVEGNGGFPITSTKFGLKLNERGFLKDKSGTVIYQGIGLLDTSDSRESFP